MPAIITTDYRIANAASFIQSINDDDIRYFTAIGRPQPWENELLPPSPIDNATQSFNVWNDAMAARRILASDVIHACPRYNWQSGVVYQPYTQDLALDNSVFYVLNSEYRVYKCIDNNGGVPSSVMPFGTELTTFTTLDGYRWKYMYTIDQSDALKFLTVDYMPVRADISVVTSSTDGMVERIVVTNGGLGYTIPPTVTVTGGGTGCAGTAIIQGGAVVRIDITNPGTGYRHATVTLTGGNGTGSTARAVISPKGGHGSDPVTELAAYYVAISNVLDSELQSVFTSMNDFRRVMIVRDPYLKNSTTVANGTMYRLNRQLVLRHVSGADTIASDEILQGSNTNAKCYAFETNVIATSPLTMRVDYVQDVSTDAQPFQLSESVVATLSGGVWQVIEDNPGQLEYETGRMIFIENRRPLMRAPDQTENLIVICEY